MWFYQQGTAFKPLSPAQPDELPQLEHILFPGHTPIELQYNFCLQGTKLVINHWCYNPQYVCVISHQSDISIIERFKSDRDHFNHNALHGTSLQPREETDNSVPFKFFLAFHRLCLLFTHSIICNFPTRGYVWQRKNVHQALINQQAALLYVRNKNCIHIWSAKRNRHPLRASKRALLFRH